MSEAGRRLVSYIEPSSWALASTAQTMTVWMTLLVTVDRYVAVCQPWRVADFATHQRRTRLGVLVVLLAAVLYNIPRYFERQVLVFFTLVYQTTTLSVTHHFVSEITFLRNFASLLIMKTYHSRQISHICSSFPSSTLSS